MTENIEITREQTLKYFKVNDKKQQMCIADENCPNFYSSTTSISNLKYHLRESHFDIYEKLLKEIQENQFIQRKLDFKVISKGRQEKINTALVRFIAQDMRPFNIVEGKGFINFIHILEPNYTLPHRTTISNNIQKLYKNCKDYILNIIKSEKIEGVSYTSDYWTSQSKDSYITMTCSFIDTKSNFHEFVLKTKEVKESHTAEQTTLEIREILKEYDLNGIQHQYITTDNGRNIKKSCREQLNIPHISCFCHNLHNFLLSIQQVGNNKIDMLFSKLRQIVKFFKLSSSNKYELEKVCLEKKKQFIKLKLDVDTRWSSLYIMINNYIIMTPIIEQMKINEYTQENLKKMQNKLKEILLSYEEQSELEQIHLFLEDFYDICQFLQNAKSVTISTILPYIYVINNLIQINHQQNNYGNKIEDDQIESKTFTMDLNKNQQLEYSQNLNKQKQYGDSSLIKSIKNHLQKQFKQYFITDYQNREGIYNLLKISCYLDPRFKQLLFLDEIEKQQTILEVAQLYKNEKQDLHDSYSGNSFQLNSRDKQKKVFELMEMLSNFQLSENEFEKYKIESSIPIKQDPMLWWNTNKEKFPILFKIMRRHLCASATSASSERIFSKAGQIINTQRSLLEPSKVDQLIYISNNMKYINNTFNFDENNSQSVFL